MARFSLLAGFFAAAAAFQSPAAPLLSSKIAASRVAPSRIAMEEPSEKAVIVGAASVGGFVGMYLFHEISAGILLASTLAYGATLGNSFGSASKTAGATASKAYSKALELNEQYDVLPKAKGALDSVSTAATNLNENYGITAKIDEQLKLSQALDTASAKVDEVKTSVNSKLADLKAKADAPPA
mmetsp:Transcript_22032/g.36389  ORF Transcript_22032/g.36389 Transcript_22032/m.36389 type:complete len:184 (-) Transcript_22032:35-586(-)|eukprot:CAMPEP_0119301086 /NCGR_PEP_ID=MMETSP1333-20130426/2924_1 /TAXON_ID=418940 /ORGANISM="Scyphosphaera apsteinii, Strain RCC1455" /LENGTH=183 /DNA_ID=CAMNT_0007303061 /DNA_START=148 /DNA_END=699 /DNA_ORIENTATION=-